MSGSGSTAQRSKTKSKKMKLFIITLRETITNYAELEVLGEDEPDARASALRSTRAVWDERDRTTVVHKVQELICRENE